MSQKTSDPLRLIATELHMPDATDRQIVERVKAMAMALRIIATWAKCDHMSQETRAAAMACIELCADRALGRDV